MATSHPFASKIRNFSTAGRTGRLFSLPALAEEFPGVARLPVSIRIVLESVLRHCDGRKITREHVEQLARWQPNAVRTEEIPFTVARVLLQDFTGVPLLADLAAMRSAAQRLGKDPKRVEPLVPVDLVVDHSITVDYYGNASALAKNMELEFQRNRERYEFMKWGMQAFDTFRVVPPGFGICHQVNGHQGFDFLGILAQALRRGTHRCQIGQQRHAGEILQHYTRHSKRNFIGTRRIGLPVSQLLHVLCSYFQAVAMAQHGFQHDAQRHRQSMHVGVFAR